MTLSASRSEYEARFGLRTALLWAVIGIAIGAAFHFDSVAAEFIQSHQIRHWKKVAGWISRYGDYAELMALGLLGLLIAWFSRRPRWTRIFTAMLISASIAGATANVIKAAAGRTRPSDNQDAAGWYGPRYQSRWILFETRFGSFPSGHTAVAAAFSGILFAARKRWGFPALILPAAIGLSRLVVGAHHLSDIVAGAALGFTIAFFTARSFLRGIAERAPMKTFPVGSPFRS